MNKKLAILFIVSALLLSACTNGEAKYPTGYDRTESNGDIYAKRQSIMGDNGFCFGGSDQRSHMSESVPETIGKTKISLAGAIKIAEAKTNGKAFDAGIDRTSNIARYDVSVLKSGKVRHVLVDARTGAAQ